MVERYLRERFLVEDAFAAQCGIGSDELRALIARGLAPGPAYDVDERGNMHSLVFGTVAAPGAPAGGWFNPAATGWVAKARRVVDTHGDDAGLALETGFRDTYRNALLDIHAAEGAIPGLSRADGHFDHDAFDAQFPALWRHFLAGTFGLCVARPVDEAHIAAKETVQARLTQLTANGMRRDFTDHEKLVARALVERYAALSLPFSPAEYDRSSRKRLIDDLLPHIAA